MVDIEEQGEEEELKENDKTKKELKPDDGYYEVDDRKFVRDCLDKEVNIFNIEVEVIFRIGVEVLGKGKDYSGVYEFQPHESLELLRYRVPFFRTFANRGYDLLEKDS